MGNGTVSKREVAKQVASEMVVTKKVTTGTGMLSGNLTHSIWSSRLDFTHNGSGQ